MARQLEHRQIYSALNALGEAKIVDLDASINSLINPIADSLAKAGVGGEVGLHVLCCNEYVLVTGLAAGKLTDIQQVADVVREAMAQG